MSNPIQFGQVGGSNGMGGSQNPSSLSQGIGPKYSGGIGGMVQGLLSGGGPNIQGPSGQAYGNIATNTGNQGAAFFNGAAGYNQAAPTINNQFQGQSQGQIAGTENSLGGVLGQYQDIISGNQPTLAQQQYQTGMNNTEAQQQALAHSAQGGAAAQAGAGRAAQQQGGMLQATAPAVSQQIRQQQIAQALQGQGQVYGQLGQLQQGQYGIEQGSAMQNAANAQTNQGQQNQQQLGLYGLGLNAYGQQMGALGGYTSGLNQAQQLQQGGQGAANQLGSQAAGAAMTAGAMALML